MQGKRYPPTLLSTRAAQHAVGFRHARRAEELLDRLCARLAPSLAELTGCLEDSWVPSALTAEESGSELRRWRAPPARTSS